MNTDKWIEKFGYNNDVITKINFLQTVKPYSDEEVIEAVDKVKDTALKCGISFEELIDLIVTNETCKLV